VTTTTKDHTAIDVKYVDVVTKDADGDVIFDMRQVEAPVLWRESDIAIVAQKYLHPKDERSIPNMIQRVVQTISRKGLELGYFEDEEERAEFAVSLFHLVVDQKFAWNSPVWFNVGIEEQPQCWACLILRVEDDMHGPDGIKAWIENEAQCFLGGSGVGVNVSPVRADREPLRSGKGYASGPVSFMQWADAGAGSIKSGGRTRRAAKMVIMDADHPDIMQFVGVKARAEAAARLLQRNSFDIALNGRDAFLVPFQNANHSVRVTDEFMESLEHDRTWFLRPRLAPDRVIHQSPRELWRAIAQAAWECADPGVQFDTTINSWHTTPAAGRINASNPCSEYMHVDDSVCNLGSINLKKFYDYGSDIWLVDDLVRTVELAITSMDIIVDLSSYPKESVERNTKALRQLGLGFTNAGALLMSLGIPYGSDEGRSLIASLQYVIQGAAARASAGLAQLLGPYAEWERNAAHHELVLERHAVEPLRFGGPVTDLWQTGLDIWNGEWRGQPQRNAQLSVIAPTGTISFLMGAETTGIEPVFSIHAQKELVGGGSVDVSSQDCVQEGLDAYKLSHLSTRPARSDTELLADEPIFHTAMHGLRPEDHLLMMAAVQPSVSGAISKTVNLPSTATVDDIADTYKEAWQLGLKAIAVYRDQSKSYQPVTETGVEPALEVKPASREKLPYTRSSVTHKFEIGNMDFYLHAGFYPDGRLGEIFLKASQEGSLVSGMMDSFATAISIGLQYGVPLEKLAEKFKHRNFEPSGVVVGDSSIKFTRSVVDYVFTWLTYDEDLGVERPIVASEVVAAPVIRVPNSLREPCPQCHRLTLEWAGSCRRCTNCAYDEGCG